jgi:hypothetical protein
MVEPWSQPAEYRFERSELSAQFLHGIRLKPDGCFIFHSAGLSKLRLFGKRRDFHAAATFGRAILSFQNQGIGT